MAPVDRLVSPTLKTKHRAALASFRNAETYIADTKLLIERRSYGHAFALLVLAEEEMGKAFLQFVEFGGFRIPRHVLTRHIPKQTVEVAAFNLFDFLLPSLRRRLAEVGLATDDRTRVGQAKQLKEDMTVLAERKIDLIRRGRIRDRRFIQQKVRQVERLRKLQGRKMDGMYVDIRKDGTISSPAEFSRHEVLEYLRVVQGNHESFLRTFGTVMTPASEEHLRKVHSKLRPVVAAFAPDMKRAISWFAEPARQG